MANTAIECVIDRLAVMLNIAIPQFEQLMSKGLLGFVLKDFMQIFK